MFSSVIFIVTINIRMGGNNPIFRLNLQGGRRETSFYSTSQHPLQPDDNYEGLQRDNIEAKY